MRLYPLAALVLLSLAALPGVAPVRDAGPRGMAVAHDGDTLRIGAAKVRIFGIDAPEVKQTCGGWDCGIASRDRLVEMIGGREVTCESRDIDKYGREVAVCRAGETDLGGTLVAEGLAWAFTRYSDDYAAAEAGARAAGLGIWRGRAEAPWEYRAEAKAKAAKIADAKAAAEAGDCRIKGNISADGARIYHLPGSAAYERVRISTAKGERWFCDESAAATAGWRAVKSGA